MTRLAQVLALGLVACGETHEDSRIMCVPPNCQLAAMSLAVEVTPSLDDRSLFADRDQEVVIDEFGMFHVVIEPLAVLRGKVTIGQSGRSAQMAASVVASRRSHIQGRPDKSYQTKIDPVTGSYTLPLPANEFYTLRIASDDTTLYPPQTFELQVRSDLRFDLRVDEPAGLVQLNGRIADLVGGPVSGLSIQALDPQTGAALSTTSATDVNGAYSIRLSRRATAVVKLVAVPIPAKAAKGTPRLETLVDVSKPQAATNTITADVTLPPMPAGLVHSEYRLVGIGSAGAPSPVAGAHCSFATELSAPGDAVIARFAVEAATDEEGYAKVDLLPATQGTRDYRLSVSPPAGSSFQGTTLTLAVGTAGGVGKEITLDRRQSLSGRVIDAFGQPLMGLAVTPRLHILDSGPGAMQLGDAVKVGITTSDKDGRFIVRTDSGIYDIGLLPPSPLQLPRRWLDAVTVSDDVDFGDLIIPAGAEVTGSVSDSSGRQLSGASVLLYAISATACTSGNCVDPPRLMAEGTTSATGKLSLVMPASVSMQDLLAP